MSGDDLYAELTELVADLGAWAAWEASMGAIALPAEPPLPVEAKPPSAAARPPRAPDRRPTPARPAPVAPRPAPVAPAPRRDAPPRPEPPARREPPAVPSGGPVNLGRWATYTQVANPDDDARRLGLATDMGGINEVLGECTRCGLCHDRRHVVFGEGATPARLVVLAAAPGPGEDAAGRPFVGPAGDMLDNMLARVLGVPREQAWLGHLARCVPPQGRDPRQDELSACRRFLDAQLSLVRPEFALLLGSAAGGLLDVPEGENLRRGVIYPLSYPGGKARGLVTFHPDHLLRRPEHKALALEDLKCLAELLSG